MARFSEKRTPAPEGATIVKHDSIDNGKFYVDFDGVADPGWEQVGNHVDEKGGLVIELEKDSRRVDIPADDLDEIQAIMREQLTEPVEPDLARSVGKGALDVAFKIPESPEADAVQERARITVIDPDAGKTYDIDVSHK